MLARAASEGISPLEVMIGAMREAWEKGDRPAAANFAKDAAPYVHPRLAAVEHSGNAEKPVAYVIQSGVPFEELVEDERASRPEDCTH